MDDAISILRSACQWHDDGQKVALASVIKTWGSAPRRTGALMCINEQMMFQGSVSGGCVETAVIEQALEVIKTSSAMVLEFGVSNEQAWEVGLACGGKIEIFVQLINKNLKEIISQLLDLNQAKQSAVLGISLGSQPNCELMTTNQLADSNHTNHDLERVRKVLLSDRPLLVEDDRERYFYLPFNPGIQVFVTGAVHIAQQLMPLITQLGFEGYIIDPRTKFAHPERFPDCTLITQWPDQALAAHQINHRCAVITLTHDPKFDDPALIAALNSPAFYIGSLGSRKTHASRIERLSELGFSPEQLSRIHAPVGLDIKAANPAEIAISIAAQLIETLRSG